MGISRLKKWDEIFANLSDEEGCIIEEDYLEDYIFSEWGHEMLIGALDIYDIYKWLTLSAMNSLRNKRCFFNDSDEFETQVIAFTIFNKQRLKLYIEYAKEGLKYYKEQNGLEKITMDPLKNKETLQKTGSVTDGRTGTNTDRTQADAANNSEETDKTGTIGLSSGNTLKQRFANSDETSYISDAPRADGSGNSTQTFNTKDKTKFQKDESVSHTFGETATRTNNTTDTKSFTKEEKTETTMKTYDPYALTHVNDFVNSLISPLLTLYMDYFFKEWTSPVVR